MQEGSYGLTANERQWLKLVCCESEERHGIPIAVRDSLLAKRLIEPAGDSYEVTSAGLAEALRTSRP